jgi:hypothetical protein
MFERWMDVDVDGEGGDERKLWDGRGKQISN